MKSADTASTQLSGMSVDGGDDRECPKRWRRRAVPAAVALTLALSWSSAASAQEVLLTAALSGLVKGFTGAAGSSLWGWMLGGSASAGSEAISDDLNSIETTLTAIDNELTAIAADLQKLQCADDADWISSGPASVITNRYSEYSNLLEFLQDNIEIPLGSSADTGSDTLYGWANRVIQGTETDDDVFDAMGTLNNETVTSISGGTIVDCVLANGNVPTAGTLDDRPYYNAYVLNITNYVVGLNTQAMIMLTEAYHIYAYGDCVGDSSTIPAVCQSSSADDVIPNLCPATNTSLNCAAPIVIYGTLTFDSNGMLTATSGQFLKFSYEELQAGGAPYSTDDYLMENGTDYLLATSIEAYTAAAGGGCGDGVLSSASPCGVTVGLYDATLTTIAYGPYGYGAGGYGTWITAPEFLFSSLLDQGFNGGSPNDVSPGDFLCTMSLTEGDRTTCTQANGGAGLSGINPKIILFDETTTTSDSDLIQQALLICFLDGGLWNGSSKQPFCAEDDSTRFFDALIQNHGGSWCGGFGANWQMWTESGVTQGQVDPNFYSAIACILPNGGLGEWLSPPQYSAQPNAPVANQFRWPALDWTQLTCSDGSSAADAANPAGVPTLCGTDFNAWFNAIVPPGPTTTTASADTIRSAAAPNTNDGANGKLRLAGWPGLGRAQAVVAFDQAEVQAFLDAGALGSARLVLTSADDSTGGRGHWVIIQPLRADFVEGNGNAAAFDRGLGSGATWHCAEDVEIADEVRDCVQEWPRDRRHWRYGWHQGWRGPRHGGRGKVVLFQEDGYAGRVSFDVTRQVRRGITAWSIEAARARGGSLSYHSKEGALLAGHEGQAPQLLLTR